MENIDFLNRFVEHKKFDEYYCGSTNIAVVAPNMQVLYATHEFNSTFNCNLTSSTNSILSCWQHLNVQQELKNALDDTIDFCENHNAIYLKKCENTIEPFLISFKPIINQSNHAIGKAIAILVIVQKYREVNLLVRMLTKLGFHMGINLPKIKVTKFEAIFSKLTAFQITIAYLTVNGYSNKNIATIINLIDPAHAIKKTSRSSINKQMEKIRDIFAFNNKNEIIDFLVRVNFHNLLPSTIFQEGILLID